MEMQQFVKMHRIFQCVVLWSKNIQFLEFDSKFYRNNLLIYYQTADQLFKHYNLYHVSFINTRVNSTNLLR